HPDHLHDRRGRAVGRAGAPALRVAGLRRDAVADGDARDHPDGDERPVLGGDGRAGPRRRRGDDRPDGHRQHAPDGLEHLQRLQNAVGQHRHRDARRGGGQHALPHAVPLRRGAVRDDLRAQHRRRGDPAAVPPEGLPAMSTATAPPAPAPPAPQPHARRAKTRSALLAHGLPLVWLNGGGLAVCLAMILGLLLLIFYQGAVSFWPGPLVEVRTVDGKVYLGEVSRTETYRPGPDVIDALPEAARAKLAQNGGVATRRQLRTGNFDLTQTHFHW